MYTRKTTNEVIRLADEGMISYRELALMALQWMSEEEVADMLRANDVFITEDE